MKTPAINYLNGLITDSTTKKELDIIDFIKKCIKEYKVVEKPKLVDGWQNYFETLWKLYPRKVDKQQAIKMFQRKIIGLDEDETKNKCNLIYKALVKYKQELERWDTQPEYVKHFATWLNAEVPNSK